MLVCELRNAGCMFPLVAWVRVGTRVVILFLSHVLLTKQPINSSGLFRTLPASKVELPE